MKRLMIAGVVVAIALFDSTLLWAKTFYLKNGEEIEYQSYRQQDDRIFLMINRDTEIDFAVAEVDFKKTARNKPAAKVKKHKKPVHVVAAVTAKPESDGVEPKTAKTAGAPHFAITMPDGCEPCSSALEKELAEVYAKYNRAAESGDFRQFEENMTEHQAKGSREALAKVTDERDRQARRKILKEMASKNYAPQACLVTPDAVTAALAGTGKNMSEGKYRDSEGTAKFVKEKGVWKVQMTMWNRKF